MIKDYIKLVAVFLVFFITINLEINKVTPPLFSYFFCALILLFGIAAYRRHRTKYVRTMFIVLAAVQFISCLVLPYWILNRSLPLNASWPYFPEVIWTAGTLAVWYYAISFVLIPVAVYLYGRRAWCSFVCGTGATAETIGDSYRTAGPKAAGVPRGFTAFKWVVLALSVAATVLALAGYSRASLFNLVFLVFFILFLRTLLMQAVNIILMPRFGNRIWCRYFCPQGLVAGLISRAGRFALVRDDSLCSRCGTCTRNCSMAVDITGGPAVNRSGECVGCGVCVEVCPQQALSMTTGRVTVPDKAGIPG